MSNSKSNLKELPDYIKVFGKKFRIEKLKEDEQEDADGIMDLASQTIKYREQPGLGYMQDTILHETVHAVDESLQLGMTEEQVHQLACGLLGVLKDNKEFTEWLLKDE
ncbi:hypothetical protein D3C87_279640 [compost metagenome]